jgi:hypothetical protein
MKDRIETFEAYLSTKRSMYRLISLAATVAAGALHAIERGFVGQGLCIALVVAVWLYYRRIATRIRSGAFGSPRETENFMRWKHARDGANAG